MNRPALDLPFTANVAIPVLATLVIASVAYGGLDPFRRLSPQTTAEVRRKAGSLADRLGLARVEVPIA